MFIFRWIFKTIAKIFMFAGIVLAIAGFASGKMLDKFYATAEQTTATISYFKDNKLLSDDPNVYVQYSVDGENYIEKLGYYDETMEVNSEVNIYYNPEVPKNIKYVGEENPTILLYVLGGLLFVAGAVIGIVRARIQRKREERKAEKRVEKKQQNDE